MVAEMLSQEEINALLGNMSLDDPSEISNAYDTNNMNNTNSNSSEALQIGSEVLTPEEIDALGEIGNISMGTAATTLFTLLNHKVMITTPVVEAMTWDEFSEIISDDLIAVSVDYTEGLTGANLLILKEHDVKVIADLMMGGTGSYIEGPITDLHLSAIAESMNQMIGSSSTSMAQIFNKKIDISPPQAIRLGSDLESVFGPKGDVVKISFRLQIEENIIDSELMQVLPIQFAKDLISGLLASTETEIVIEEKPVTSRENRTPELAPPPVQPTPTPTPNYRESDGQPYYNPQPDPYYNQVTPPQNMHYYGEGQQGTNYGNTYRRDVDVQTPQFQSFDKVKKVYPKENMDLLMDVSLEVSTELGRTTRKIKEILEFGPGSIIELNRLVGEPVDVLVNGKFIATGEVVVIDENFGIRITDIINPEDRI
ncbi:flagellar motor switch phosphatase FliY [Sporanaerobium hydrogeniformans]|uniref:Flagellar motor switch phosphatase FliY n=1 Tax=Sporanaerobium hydrogeniformans TaxID=3072179 RepID=A0AC61DGM5_9FIRM|nr:flagellar motor switch phosphatase FliY [Sporanaerobium hydrogeniformans]PHV71752.1 flagellar motor switch phosphatase FliY [Sporanaerobium hydrogeniformans]